MITGSVAATAASLGSGIAASVLGVEALAGGAIVGGVAVAAAVPLAASVVLGFGAYGTAKLMDAARSSRRTTLLEVLSRRALCYGGLAAPQVVAA